MKEFKAFTGPDGSHRIELVNKSRRPEFFLPTGAKVTSKTSNKLFAEKVEFPGVIYLQSGKTLFNPGEIAIIEWVPDKPLPKRSSFLLKLLYVDSDSLANYMGDAKPFKTTFMTM